MKKLLFVLLATTEAGRLEIVSMTIQSGEEIIVGRRLRAVLAAARRAQKS